MVNKYRTIVLNQLITNPETRSNDKLLIKNVIKEKYGTTDINDLMDVKGNVFESIRRCRQHIQRINPNLKPDIPVETMREALEREVRKEVRGL